MREHNAVMLKWRSFSFKIRRGRRTMALCLVVILFYTIFVRQKGTSVSYYTHPLSTELDDRSPIEPFETLPLVLARYIEIYISTQLPVLLSGNSPQRRNILLVEGSRVEDSVLGFKLPVFDGAGFLL